MTAMVAKRPKVYLDHKPKTVALVCMGPSVTDYLAPTLTQEFNPAWVDEVWAINMATNAFRADLVFWMDDLIEQEKFRPNLFVALRRYGMPVITSIRRPTVVPNSFDYPIDEVGAIGTPVWGKPYLNNGVAMAIAYAMWKGVKTMSIYGADFSYPNRDFAESGRACVESWVTLAATRDMEIRLPPQTSLMDMVKDHGIYGYREQPEIVLPDGRIFKYIKRGEIGRYIPEDSSGVKNANLPAPIPGEGSGGAAADAAEPGRDAAPNQAARDAPPAARASRAGLQHQPRKRGRPKGSTSKTNGDGRGAGRVPQAAGQNVVLPAGADRPGPKA
jgi:hypothetical protein